MAAWVGMSISSARVTRRMLSIRLVADAPPEIHRPSTALSLARRRSTNCRQFSKPDTRRPGPSSVSVRNTRRCFPACNSRSRPRPNSGNKWCRIGMRHCRRPIQRWLIYRSWRSASMGPFSSVTRIGDLPVSGRGPQHAGNRRHCLHRARRLSGRDWRHAAIHKDADPGPVR